MDYIKVDKTEAARRQIDAAIALLFSGGEPLAVHTLANAGNRILRDLWKAGDTPERLAFARELTQTDQKRLWDTINRGANFLKHADRDSDVILIANDILSDFIILMAIWIYLDLGHKRSVEMVAFERWCYLVHPEFAPERPEIVSSNLDEIRAIVEFQNAPRASQLKTGEMILEQLRQSTE